MSLFQCQHCGCCENTALSWQGFSRTMGLEDFDWTGLGERKGKLLCSACGPAKFTDGSPTECGQWHGQFQRTYLPLGMFKTAGNGNLEHIQSGDQDFRKYAIQQPDPATPGDRK